MRLRDFRGGGSWSVWIGLSYIVAEYDSCYSLINRVTSDLVWRGLDRDKLLDAAAQVQDPEASGRELP